jgi:hypothetical protein
MADRAIHSHSRASLYPVLARRSCRPGAARRSAQGAKADDAVAAEIYGADDRQRAAAR